MIHVIAVITAHPGKRQAILDILMPRVPAVRAEPGCIEYTVTVDTGTVADVHPQTKFGPDTFVAIEKWESLALLEAHSKAPQRDDYWTQVRPLMASRIVHFMSTVPEA